MSQSLAGTNIEANATATARTIAVELRIAWGRDGDEWPSDWATQSTVETTRLLDVSWDRSLSLDSRNGTVAQLRLTLDNRDQRYSPLNSSGALYASISAATSTPGGESVRYPAMWSTPVRLRMGFVDSTAGAEYLTVFSGCIDAVAEGFGVSGDTVTLTVLDRGMLLLKNKASTQLYQSMRADEWVRFMVSSLGGIATGATFDRGLHLIPWVWLDDENLWAEIQQAAVSDSGYCYFDELGAAYYRNATWWYTADDSITPQASFTTARLQDLQPKIDYSKLATGAIVQYQPRSPGGEQVIWRADDTIVVPPEGKTIDARFSYPTSTILAPAKPGDWFPVTAGGVDMSDQVELLVASPSYAQRATLTFTNNSNQTVFIPKMQLRGLVLLGGPQEEIERNVAVPLTPKNQIIIGGNPYIQTAAQAELVATVAAYRAGYPRLTYQISGAPALPWLQLGDCVEIATSGPLSTARNAIVTELSFSWRPDAAWLMSVTAVDKAALYEYDDYHIIGTDDYGAGVVFV